jgi:hypothetical protein
MGDKVRAAQKGVDHFHAQLNTQQFDAILGHASPEYRKVMTAEENRKLFTGIHKKLGDAGDWGLEGWSVNFTPSGPVVRLQCKTKFALGEAQETFLWRIIGSGPSLLGYNINSAALISD